ncbi:lanthionine synthetase C family protein [Bacillus sp. FJAT-27245]|uniref:lanthionine synthetase C family protein n=1 Tax=Bacillus sp. FJAT-27245 TaxID=1684144 RepID=UPI0006A7A0DE|nr:lanthionine synthetase C family protein [Bacillus sp. FJAT-27245]
MSIGNIGINETDKKIKIKYYAQLFAESLIEDQYIPPKNDISLSKGLLGHSLFLGEMSNLFPDQGYEKFHHKCFFMIKNIIENEGLHSLSLWQGLSGFGLATTQSIEWNLGYNNLLNVINNQLNIELKSYIKQIQDMKNELSVSHYDTILGATGIGRYLLIHAKTNEELCIHLELILRYLIDLSRINQSEAGIKFLWHIKQENQLERDKQTFPSGLIDLGIAHGVSGPLALLSLSFLMGIKLEGQEEAIKSIVTLLMKHCVADKEGDLLWPGRIDPQKETKANSYHAWCYGTPGIARALWLAGRALNDKRLMNLSTDVFERLTRYKIETWPTKDFSICHGYSGMLLLINRMYEDTKNANLVKLRDNLINFILEKVESSPNQLIMNSKQNDNGFLDGLTGMYTTLVSQLNGSPPSWDSSLLIS